MFIQSDNCFADNKNRWMLALLKQVTLVEKNWFKEIHLNMLPPGHTHKDIDALFGEFGQQLPRYPVYDIDQATQEFFPRVFARRAVDIRQSI